MKKLMITLFLMTTTAAMAGNDPMQDIIINHLKRYSQLEHFSAIAVSIKAGDKLNNYVAGFRSRDAGSAALTTTDLFDIGSITKSFTAALAVIADSDDKLKLKNTVGQYLKNYPHWGSITLTGLLNMSTGIPNYSNAPKINYLMSQNLRQFWSPSALIDLVYPKHVNPPRKPGYFYSNTGYILMDMILSAQYKKPFDQLLIDKIIKPLDLKNTFYPLPDYSKPQLQRLVRGYSYNIYDNPELVGQDVTENNLSWAGAAGAIIANSEDVLHWVEDLFVNDKLLTLIQKNKMQELISLTTGKSIEHTDKGEPRGFGLGIVQGFDKKIGHYWLYEGETLGYRALYMYVPCNKIIVVTLFNSATNSENDHSGELMLALYHQVLKQDNSLICKPISKAAG